MKYEITNVLRESYLMACLARGDDRNRKEGDWKSERERDFPIWYSCNVGQTDIPFHYQTQLFPLSGLILTNL